MRGTGRAQRAGCPGVPAPGSREVALEPGSTGGPAPAPARLGPAGGHGLQPVRSPPSHGSCAGWPTHGLPGPAGPGQPSPFRVLRRPSEGKRGWGL